METLGLEDTTRREPAAEKVYTWQIREGLAQDLRMGNWIMNNNDECRRIKHVERIWTGMRNVCKVHYVLDDGTRHACLGGKEITMAVRTRVR
jgi:hypothetical protein